MVNISDVEKRVQGFRGQKNIENRRPSGNWLGTELDFDNGRVSIWFNCVSCLILGPIMCDSELCLGNNSSLC